MVCNGNGVQYLHSEKARRSISAGVVGVSGGARGAAGAHAQQVRLQREHDQWPDPMTM